MVHASGKQGVGVWRGVILLGFLMCSLGSPGSAQTNFDQEIQSLERALEEVKESVRAGQDVGLQIELLEDQLNTLKRQVARPGLDVPEEGEDAGKGASRVDIHAPPPPPLGCRAHLTRSKETGSSSPVKTCWIRPSRSLCRFQVPTSGLRLADM